MNRDEDLARAAAGMYTALEYWIALLIHFVDLKLKDDPDWKILRHLLHTLHIDNMCSRVPVVQIMEIIEHNRPKIQ